MASRQTTNLSEQIVKTKRKLRSWWRRESAVSHRDGRHGSIVNFIGCANDEANVYFYLGDSVEGNVKRSNLKRAGTDWTSATPTRPLGR